MSNYPARNRVLLVGDVMRDVIVKPSGALRIGSDTKAEIEMTSGGSAANQAIWLAANGVLARLVARVGFSDVERLSAQFVRYGVEPIFTGDTSRPTGSLVALIGEDGERSFYTDRGANEALCGGDVPEGVFDQVGLVLLSGYSFFLPAPREVAQEIMTRAKKMGIGVAIDPSSAGFIKDVGVNQFLAWTKGADVLFPNAEEAELLSGETDTEAQLRALSAHYKSVVLTQGALGAAMLSSKGDVIEADANEIEVVDTTGAGDAFVGGFISAKMEGLALKDCLERGVLQGEMAVGQMGGQPKIR